MEPVGNKGVQKLGDSQGFIREKKGKRRGKIADTQNKHEKKITQV